MSMEAWEVYLPTYTLRYLAGRLATGYFAQQVPLCPSSPKDGFCPESIISLFGNLWVLYCFVRNSWLISKHHQNDQKIKDSATDNN